MARVSSSLPQSSTIFSAANGTLSRQRAILAASLYVMTTRLMGIVSGEDIGDSPALWAGTHRPLPCGQHLLRGNVQHRAAPFVFANDTFNHGAPAARCIHIRLGVTDRPDLRPPRRSRHMRRPGIDRHQTGGTACQPE